MNHPSEEPIPENIRRFVVDHINSVESLETLLLCFSETPREYNAAEVSRRLYTSLESATARLHELHRARLLVVSGADPVKYRFDSTGKDVAVVGELEKLYKLRRVSLISFIYSKPTDPLRAFSDAFRLRKDEP